MSHTNMNPQLCSHLHAIPHTTHRPDLCQDFQLKLGACFGRKNELLLSMCHMQPWLLSQAAPALNLFLKAENAGLDELCCNQ